MAARDMRGAIQGSPSILETNKVLKNTYLLLYATLAFSALMASIAMTMRVGTGAYFMCLIASMVLGMFGFGTGPIVGLYLSLGNGPQIVATALGGTAGIFLGLSAYAVSTKRDFSFMTGFVFAGMMAVLGLMIVNIFMGMPLLSLALAGAVILLMSALILMQTGAIIRGGETNYIMATYSLYLSFFNIFIHLLSILGMASGDD